MGGRVVVEREGPIGWLVFDHAERRNAISMEMWESIPAAIRELDEDRGVRVVVMRGAGEVAFVSGADISEFGRTRTGAEASSDYEATTGRAFGALVNCSKPLVAMIHGFCVGGGMAIALAADLRYAADDAVFAIPAARLGLGYHVGGIQALIDLVGPSTAKEIFFTAQRYSADQAARLGVLNRVFPKPVLEEEVREIVAKMAGNAPLTVASVKLIVRELGREPGARNHGAMADSIHTCFESDDYKEGVRAFLEKRRPEFEGR